MGQTFSKQFGSLFNKIAEVDNEVDNEQIPQPELEYGLIYMIILMKVYKHYIKQMPMFLEPFSCCEGLCRVAAMDSNNLVMLGKVLEV